MNVVDYGVLGILAVSGLLALLRGFVREVLGIAAWIGAAVVALWAEPEVLPYVKQYVGQWVADPQLQACTGFAVAFLPAIIVLLTISHWVGALVRRSVARGVDRSLGVVFGVLRGAALVVVAYFGASWMVPIERWPDLVLQARTLPLAYQGAAWLAEQVPLGYRPMLHVPPRAKDPNAADLLQSSPAGGETGPSPTR